MDCAPSLCPSDWLAALLLMAATTCAASKQLPYRVYRPELTVDTVSAAHRDPG